MMRSAAVRLALSYLMVIMGLSFGFSVIIYRVSHGELDRGLRQLGLTQRVEGFNSPDFESLRQARLQESSQHLRNNLILLNIAVLIFGGGLSYYLAVATLKPIEDSLDAQSRFSSDASHELRTPLTAMKTEIEVALRSQNLTKNDAKALLKSNLEEVSKLEALSSGLLRLARVGGDGLEITALQLHKVVGAATTQVAKNAAAKNITLKNEVPQLNIEADKHTLIEALVILLDNAIKYSPAGKDVKVTSQQHGHHVFINIVDNGNGIKASDLPHIFDRFYRADASRSKEQQPGYGLGLAIAQKIVKLHKGSLSAKSTIGQGSTFTIKLPYKNTA